MGSDNDLAINFQSNVFPLIVSVITLLSCNKCCGNYLRAETIKVENIQEDSLDSIPSPPPLVKIQVIGGKVY
jgi:hypothetical protein